MAHPVAKIVGASAGALALLGAGLAFSARGEESGNPAVQVVADLPTVSDFSLGMKGDCAYDADRGGLLIEGITIRSRSTGVLDMSFYVEHGSSGKILPGYVSTVLAFDRRSRSHTFDVVLPVSRTDYEDGYRECSWSTGGR